MNRDTLGFVVELMPQSGADERMVEILLSLYATCPSGTGIQFSLFASPHLHRAALPLRQPACRRRRSAAEKARERGRAARNSNLYRTLARRRVAHYLRGSHVSLTQGYHYTVRDFKLLMSVTPAGRPRQPLAPGRSDHAARGDDLDAALGQLPEPPCSADDLINWCALFTQPAPDDARSHRPRSTTTTAGSCATRSSISTPSRRHRRSVLRSARPAIPVRSKRGSTRSAVPRAVRALADERADRRSHADGAPVRLPVPDHDGGGDPRSHRDEVGGYGQPHARDAERGKPDGEDHARRREEEADWERRRAALDARAASSSRCTTSSHSLPRRTARPRRGDRAAPSGARVASSSTTTCTCIGNRCTRACR